MNWGSIAETISQHTGQAFKLESWTSVGGGCINSAFHLKGKSQHYFIKLNTSDLLQMFEAEADGLAELHAGGAVRVPQPVCTGIENNQAYLVMEYVAMRSGGDMVMFGEQLARMHMKTVTQFGWYRDNAIGSTPQINNRKDDWLSFWRRHRLGYQLQLARNNGASYSLISQCEQLMERFDGFFVSYQPEASLLHGDLWSGNYAMTENNEPVIFDPAVYFGDREADLAMTELFGGFGEDFYAAYHAAWAIDSGYKVRKTFYNLYHILNHFNLFGGGYAGRANTMCGQLLAELK